MASNDYLRFLRRFNIKKCDGVTTVANAKNVFSLLDDSFKKVNISGEATPATAVEVYELITYGSLYFAFRSINSDFDKLVFTQNQIVEICENHSGYLHPDSSTHFLTNIDDEYVVVMAVARHKSIWRMGALGPNQAQLCASRPRIMVPLSSEV